MANTPDGNSILAPRSPFSDLRTASAERPGVVACDRDGLGIATVLTRKGKSSALAQCVRERFDIELPEGPRRASAGALAFAGIGPRAWLATYERGGNSFALELAKVLGDSASVSDQSDGYAILRLSGPEVRNTLCKLVTVDLHPRAFKIGDVAATVAADIGVTLWRLKDRDDGLPAIEIALLRSFASSFWKVLSESAAEFGLLLRLDRSTGI